MLAPLNAQLARKLFVLLVDFRQLFTFSDSSAFRLLTTKVLS